MQISRRRWLMNALFGTGLLGLRSLATGIPISILADPRRALAGPMTPAPPAQYIILSTSADGDPITCNVPGTYTNPDLGHPMMPSMAPTSLSLSGTTFTAGQPWAMLPQPLLDRTCFFHHATYSVVHSDQQKVQSLGGYTSNNEMFASLLAANLAPKLGTVQAQPVVLGPRNSSEQMVYQSQPQPIFSPTALPLLLSPPTGPIASLTQLRDSDLNRLNALIRCEGTPAQAAFIDQYVQSQSQVRALSESLLSVLQTIQADDINGQILAAITLIRMNVAPVISLHIPCGGDNHGDSGLQTEAMQSVTGIAAIGNLWNTLATNSLQDKVSFLSLNVFGRTMSSVTTGLGRAHNANHHAAIMFGKAFQGSVVGGIEPAMPTDFGAMSIDATTGAGIPGGAGNIPFNQTLQSMALTFGQGVGADLGFLQANITGGTVVQAALAPS